MRLAIVIMLSFTLIADLVFVAIMADLGYKDREWPPYAVGIALLVNAIVVGGRLAEIVGL